MTDLWNKLKQYFGYIILGLGAVITLLLYILNLKDNELDAEKVDQKLQKTTTKSNELDSQIAQEQQVVNTDNTKINNLTNQDNQITKEEQQVKPSNDPVTYWKNN